MGSLTRAQIWVLAVYTRRGVRHKQVCTRVDSEEQKNGLSPCPTRGSNPGSSDSNSNAETTELRPPFCVMKEAPCTQFKLSGILARDGGSGGV